MVFVWGLGEEAADIEDYKNIFVYQIKMVVYRPLCPHNYKIHKEKEGYAFDRVYIEEVEDNFDKLEVGELEMVFADYLFEGVVFVGDIAFSLDFVMVLIVFG